MKKGLAKILFLGFVTGILFCSIAHADQGVVARNNNGKIAISYNLGFLLVEWYGGYSPMRGDIYVGDFSGYGMKDIYCTTAGATTSFYVEEYMAGKDEALKFLFPDQPPSSGYYPPSQQSQRSLAHKSQYDIKKEKIERDCQHKWEYSKKMQKRCIEDRLSDLRE